MGKDLPCNSSPHPKRRRLSIIRGFIVALLSVVWVTGAYPAASQNGTINLSFKQEKLVTVLNRISAETGYQFFYQKGVIPENQLVTASFENADIKTIIDKLLTENGYAYQIVNKTVAITRARAQQSNFIRVQGLVVDTKGNPMVGASIMVKGTQRGVTTDAMGAFSMTAAANDVIEFSFLGYQSISILASETAKFARVVMKEISTKIDEVQIVAYGEQLKREVTGSISSLKAEDLKDLPSASLANLLQGKAAGVSIINTTGAPGGGGTSITVRGFNSLSVGGEDGRRLSNPLWVIDDVPVPQFVVPATGTDALADIDPNFIESIEILKDASATAIYGSRAANGVILVKTKRGRIGKPKITANYSSSWNFNGKMPNVTGGNMERWFRNQQAMNYVTGYRQNQYAEGSTYAYYMYTNPSNYEESYKNKAHYDLYWYQGQGFDIPALQDSLNSFYNNSTDWFDEFLQVGRVHSANVQVSGGSDQSIYHIGLGLYDEQGILIGSDFTRFNLLANYTNRPTERLMIDNRISIAYTDRSNSGGSIYEGIGLFNINPYNLSTLIPGTNSAVWDNVMRDMSGSVNKNYDYKLRENLTVSYHILNNLKISTSGAIDFWQNMADSFRPAAASSQGWSQAGGTIGRSLTLQNENLITYNFKRDNHRFDALAGFSVNYDQIDRILGNARGGASDYIHYAVGFPDLIEGVYNEASGTYSNYAMQSFSSSQTKKSLVSWFGRINYTFKDRYMLALSVRRDGSSTFGANNRWGTFPAVSAGWIFSDEPFLENLNWLSFGKVRASVGKSGQHFSQAYLALGVYTSSADEIFLGQSTLSPEWKEGLYNPNLTWEETTQYDVGLDLELFNSRFRVTTDYYYRYTDGLLANVTLPGSNSYNAYQTQWRNAYAISNQGIELKVETDFFRTKDFTWEFTFNIARNWNRFEGAEDRYDFATTSNNYNIVGKPLNQIYVYKHMGIYQEDGDVPIYDYIRDRYVYKLAGGGTVTNVYRAGDPIYLDVNQDGYISAADKVYGGSPLPEFTGGINSLFKYKNFDFNVLFTFVMGRTVLNSSLGDSFQFDIVPNIATNTETIDVGALRPILTDLSNYSFWSSHNTDATLAMMQADPGRYLYTTASSAYLQKVHFLKLKSFVLGYNLKNPFKNSDVGFRIFVSGENLWTLTNYKGRDPEAIDIVTGIDRSQTYPLSTRITAGLTITF